MGWKNLLVAVPPAVTKTQKKLLRNQKDGTLGWKIKNTMHGKQSLGKDLLGVLAQVLFSLVFISIAIGTWQVSIGNSALWFLGTLSAIPGAFCLWYVISQAQVRPNPHSHIIKVPANPEHTVESGSEMKDSEVEPLINIDLNIQYYDPACKSFSPATNTKYGGGIGNAPTIYSITHNGQDADNHKNQNDKKMLRFDTVYRGWIPEHFDDDYNIIETDTTLEQADFGCPEDTQDSYSSTSSISNTPVPMKPSLDHIYINTNDSGFSKTWGNALQMSFPSLDRKQYPDIQLANTMSETFETPGSSETSSESLSSSESELDYDQQNVYKQIMSNLRRRRLPALERLQKSIRELQL